MTSGIIAALIGALALGFAEGLARFYPAHRTWLRLRSRNGRRAVRAMRERFEGVATSRAPGVLAIVLLGLVLGWIASASLLDKRWHEVAADVAPYLFVTVIMIRTPGIMRSIADRMRDYERDIGEDPDRPLPELHGEGPGAIAL